MSLKFEFHSDTLHAPISANFKNYAIGCESIDIAVGFLSQSGLDQIVQLCKKNPTIQLVRIVCGAITGKAVKLSAKLASSKGIKIKIDLPYFSKKQHFAPMMHSKVYIFKAGHKRTSVVGSSNLSHFALEGKNVEANTIVEGDKTEKIFKDQQSHFDKIWIRSSNLNHKLALYYDTFFKHCSEGFSIQEFKGSQFETVTSTAIQSILNIFNTTSIPSVRDTIVFLEPPTHFRTLAETYHLLHIGHDDFIVAKCFGGKRTSGAGSSTEEHKFKITYKKPSYELQTCGSIAIRSTIEFTTLEVVELVKSHEIISGNFKFSKKAFRSKTWIIDHLKLNPLDTILINPAEVREDKKLTENDLKLEKIIGFKETKANKLLAKVISNIDRVFFNERSTFFFDKIDYELFEFFGYELDTDEPKLPEILLGQSKI